MNNPDLDQLRIAYKRAIHEWVDTVRAEEALAAADHSMVGMEHFRRIESIYGDATLDSLKAMALPAAVSPTPLLLQVGAVPMVVLIEIASPV
jgi:hypothetical protein